MVLIKCANIGGHLFIQDSQTIKIQHIIFVECGFNKNFKLKYNYYKNHYSYLTPAITFVHCTNLQITSVDFQNSFGSNLVAINSKNLTVQDISFYHTKLFDHNDVARSGIIIEFTKAYQFTISYTTLSVINCHFHNFDGMMRDREAALSFKGGTAMTIMSNCGQSPQTTIQINIKHYTFGNNFINRTTD